MRGNKVVTVTGPNDTTPQTAPETQAGDAQNTTQTRCCASTTGTEEASALCEAETVTDGLKDLQEST